MTSLLAPVPDAAVSIDMLCGWVTSTYDHADRVAMNRAVREALTERVPLVEFGDPLLDGNDLLLALSVALRFAREMPAP